MLNSFNPVTKILSGQEEAPIFNPGISLGRIIFECLQNRSNEVLQHNITDNIKLTRKDVLKKSIQIAMFLRDQDLKENYVVSMISTPTSFQLPIIYGCVLAGNPLHILPPLTGNIDIIKSLCSQTRPKLIFCTENFLKYFECFKAKIVLIDSVKDIFCKFQDETKFQPSTVSGNAPAIILNTTGSTGHPKPVPKSHSSFISTLKIDLKQRVILARQLQALPMIQELFQILISNSKLIQSNDEITLSDLPGIIEKHDITKITVLPNFLESLFKRLPDFIKEFQLLEEIVCIGWILPTYVKEEVQGRLSPSCKLYDAYGCSEVGTISINSKLVDLEVKIIDDQGRSLGPGNRGEIVVKRFKENKWITPGDMGFIDEFNDLHILDRKGDVFHLNNSKIYPSEIENELLRVSGVQHAYVTTVGDGFLIALIVKEESSKVSENDVKENILKIHYEFHGRIYFLENLRSISQNMKINRKLVKKVAEEFWISSKSTIA
ncbi:hypothetical protein ACFFRR_004752 [Megaselia abdita]